MTKKIYRRPARRPVRHWVERASYLGVGLGIILIALVVYFEFSAPEVIPPLSLPEAADMQDRDESAHPDLVVLVDPVEEEQPEEEEDDPNFFQGKIASNEPAGVLLQRWLGASEINAMVEASKNVYSLDRVVAGQPYSVHLEDGRFLRFEYEVDARHKNADHMLIVTREQDGEKVNWQARLEKIEYTTKLDIVEGEITAGSSLYLAMARAVEEDSSHLSSQLAMDLVKIFDWEINFFRDIQPGDSFRLLVEKRYRDGEFKGFGAMPAVEFVNRNSKFEAYAFKDSFGNNSYFNAAGDSLKRAFLKAPLDFTRVSSGFNMKRMHPIHKVVRPHYGVDYAAPTGTPIRAIGAGEVTFRGFDKGAGNYVALKHARGYESMYLHMSRFADGLKKGSKVRQGQIIGYVGSTGYSTGPHLCFRIKLNGQFLNPEKVLSPRDESVPQKHLAAFKAGRDRWRGYLKGEITLSEYSREKENL